MGKLVLFRELEEKVLEDTSLVTLFGKRDFFRGQNESYNLIFHANSVADKKSTDWSVDLVIPVFRDSEDRSRFKEVYLRENVFPIFAVGKNMLRFYSLVDINPSLGIIANEENRYLIPEEEFYNFCLGKREEIKRYTGEIDSASFSQPA